MSGEGVCLGVGGLGSFSFVFFFGYLRAAGPVNNFYDLQSAWEAKYRKLLGMGKGGYFIIFCTFLRSFVTFFLYVLPFPG